MKQKTSNRQNTDLAIFLLADNHKEYSNNASSNSSTTNSQNCGTSSTNSNSMSNKRHSDDLSLTPGGSTRIPLARSCSSPAVSYGK